MPTAELVVNLFRECSEVEDDFHGLCNDSIGLQVAISLLFAALLKITFTLVTFGIKVPAGVFIPSMAIGACVGRTVGMILQAWQTSNPDSWVFASCKSEVQCITPGTYASTNF